MLTRAIAWLRGLFNRRRLEAEIEAELCHHVEMEVSEQVARGMSPEDARRIALRDFGGVLQTTEAVREVRATVFDAIARDVRIAARMLARSPSFSIATTLTLALGIGANTAIFSVVDATLIRALPYPDADRVVRLKGPTEQSFIQWGGPDSFSVSPPELRGHRAFSALGAAALGGLNLGTDAPERVAAAAVTPGFFDAIGVTAAVGRLFTARDAELTPDIAVISDKLWRRRFAADPGLPGHTVVLNGRRYTVTGVMPPRVSYPSATDVWLPNGALFELIGTIPTGVVVGRLAPGTTTDQALGVVTRIRAAQTATVTAAKGRRPTGPTVSLPSVRDELVGQMRPVVILIALSACLVLLVSCVNAAQLLLARVASRNREFAVRRALGAARRQLVRQVLVESLLLSLSAGVLAIPAAAWTIRALLALLPANFQNVGEIAVDIRTLGATAAFSVLTAVLFGSAPALSLPCRGDADVLRAMPGASGDRLSKVFRRILVVTQIAAALTLLAGGVTVVRTVAMLMQVDTGVRLEDALSFDLMLPEATYPSKSIRPVFAAIEERLSSLRGVEAVGSTTQVPGDPDPMILFSQVAMDGHFIGQDSASRFAVRLFVSPGYFAASGIALLAGRDFNKEDRKDTPCVVVVSETLARVAGTSPAAMLGRRLDHDQMPYAKGCAVIGVVRDILLDGPERRLRGTAYISDATLRAAIYLPFGQSGYSDRRRHVVLRSRLDPGTLARAIRAAVAVTDQSLPVYNLRTFHDIRAASIADRRFAMTALLAFGLLAAALSALGLYSVMSHAVQQRTREIGIRLALGASPEQVRGLVLRNGLAVASSGLFIGAICTAVSWRIVVAEVPKVGQMEVTTVAALATAILCVALIATWLPARRATRVDPVVTLRSE